jgi:hypothetical protein
MLTNLRLVWSAASSRRTNISIGHAAIVSLNVRPSTSRLKGSCTSLYIMARQGQQRFEVRCVCVCVCVYAVLQRVPGLSCPCCQHTTHAASTAPIGW